MTHFNPEGYVNIGNINIRGAWEDDKVGTDIPVAITPTYTHPRMTAQRSCFTVHGKIKKSLCEILSVESGNIILNSYFINSNKKEEMLEQLRCLGVSQVTLFPEIDVLANDLTELFRPDL